MKRFIAVPTKVRAFLRQGFAAEVVDTQSPPTPEDPTGGPVFVSKHQTVAEAEAEAKRMELTP